MLTPGAKAIQCSRDSSSLHFGKGTSLRFTVFLKDGTTPRQAWVNPVPEELRETDFHPSNTL